MSQKSLKVLWLEDELFTWKHLRVQLENAGHTVVMVRSLGRAYTLLSESFATLNPADKPFDVVLIDLKVPLGEKGERHLPQALADQNVVPPQSEVIGQALGAWLWTVAGRRKNRTRPWHLYLTSVTDLFEANLPQWDPEFKATQGNLSKQFVVSKWGAECNDLGATLQRLGQLWQSAWPDPANASSNTSISTGTSS
jgi:CheY-like chemotaxis protein